MTLHKLAYNKWRSCGRWLNDLFLIFSSFSQNQTKLPKQLKYSVRMPSDPSWYTGQLFDTAGVSKQARDGYQPFPYPMNPPYYRSCFLTIQNNIERTFIKKTSNKDPPKIQMKRFPYPQITEDMFVTYAGQYFPYVFLLCMLLSMKNIIKVSHWLALPTKRFSAKFVGFLWINSRINETQGTSRQMSPNWMRCQ